ncbi:hypothetical protein [Kribbella sp. NBC_00889]|uniref:hypothetical protein n=1 Tax=Kribbella sp. NBC_00889 TaxID=2975974 RepID=UPI00386F8958|nr:hypothetical protein OG817_22200 [Kribbella sp. NBC_00889]
MSNSAAQRARVATAISVIKWILIALAITTGAVSVLAAVLDDGANSITVALAVAAGTAVWSLFVWVLFGWFEHTLMALVTISRNTAVAVPASRYDVPPAPYEPTV